MRIITTPRMQWRQAPRLLALLAMIGGGIAMFVTQTRGEWLALSALASIDAVQYVMKRRRARGNRRPPSAGHLPNLAIGTSIALAALLLVDLLLDHGFGALRMLAVLAAVAAAYVSAEIIRRRRAMVKSTALRPCRYCGYERRDLGPRAVCPECGRSPWL